MFNRIAQRRQLSFVEIQVAFWRLLNAVLKVMRPPLEPRDVLGDVIGH